MTRILDFEIRGLSFSSKNVSSLDSSRIMSAEHCNIYIVLGLKVINLPCLAIKLILVIVIHLPHTFFYNYMTYYIRNNIYSSKKLWNTVSSRGNLWSLRHQLNFPPCKTTGVMVGDRLAFECIYIPKEEGFWIRFELWNMLIQVLVTKLRRPTSMIWTTCFR